MSGYTLHHGDLREVLPGLGLAAHAVVTDPPYELNFMGKAWDRSGVAFDPASWRVCLDALKPGGWLLAFGGTRTWHRIAVAIEDAGFEIRDTICWLYGTGFPKSKNLKGGLGTALKPAFEPIIVARKPFIGSVARNVMSYGSGVLNIDECRVATDEVLQGSTVRDDIRGGAFASGHKANPGDIPDYQQNPAGRWPANVIHDGSDEVLEAFAEFGGKGGNFCPAQASGTNVVYGKIAPRSSGEMGGFGDSGSAARFFYAAKASRSERGEGNTHPTVKPLALMEYLVKLVNPAKGLVLDPYAGSGSTGVACLNLGVPFVGVELDAGHCEIARRRLDAADRSAAEKLFA